MLKLYNTLTRKKETFKPIKKNEVGIYSCGPTVYDYPHVGNLRAFVFPDILKRWLEYRHYKVNHIMNITDVDDKLILKSEGKRGELKEITKRYEDAFKDNLKELNIIPANVFPRATEHIKEMTKIIEKLEKNGYAYKTNDGIYFSIKKFKNYGKLSRLKIENLKEGARIDTDKYEKENAQDFALWKFYNEKDGEIYWDTELGKGRPGWHIECSAMSSKYLGESFDIHTGGIDLIFPHHTNEIAQSEGANKKKFVKYWMHNNFILVNGEKMSKSLGNFYVLKDLLDKGWSLNAIRYILLSTHYRQELNISDDGLKAAEESVKRIFEFLDNSKGKEDNKEVLKQLDKAEEEFGKAMDDDLNIAQALGVLFGFIRDANREGAGDKSYNFIKSISEKVLGLKKEKVKIPVEIKKLADEREQARKNKDWKKSDKLREELKSRGWEVADTSEGWRLKKI
jgi:cysteinyl-tRNA synthetase